jgi:uncharacterized membrane protein YdbT with pleckstrin-like domain
MLVIRPTFKFVAAGYVATLVLAVIAGVLWFLWVPWLAPLGTLLWTLQAHFRQRGKMLIVADGRLKLETGLASRSTQTMHLSKVQDVRVEQSVWQRMLGVGNLSVETAGESGRIAIESIDDPHGVSDRILAAAKAIAPEVAPEMEKRDTGEPGSRSRSVGGSLS